MSERTGGPAFPSVSGIRIGDREKWDPGAPGMTLRDYFAGQALAGICAAQAHPMSTGYEPDSEEAAQAAYRVADAMLAERDR